MALGQYVRTISPQGQLKGEGVTKINEHHPLLQQVFEEVNKECNCDGLSTEDFHYAISRSPDFARFVIAML